MTAPASAMSKLEIQADQIAKGAICLHVSGVIDERFEASRVFGQAEAITILDLEGIKRITSFGVRQWSEAMKTLPSTIRHLYLVRCPPSFLDQLNMVLNFGGRSEIITATAVFFCEKCDEERNVMIDVMAHRSQIAAGQGIAATCPECQGPLRLDDEPQQYFRFVSVYGVKSIDPAAMQLLEHLGLYKAHSVGRPPDEIKLVHGDVTLFKISGSLDQRFRPKRLASGVEGNVVIDLGDVESVDDTGTKRWRQLLEALQVGATSIVLADVPEPVLPHIAAGRFSTEDTVVHSARVHFRCSACGTETLASLRPDQYPDPPPRPCPRCGKDSTLATIETALDIVFRLARNANRKIPASAEEVIRLREEILSRARAEAGESQRAGADGGLSRYRVIKPLTHGGMAEILLAVQQGIGGFEKLIALKKIRREMLERRHIAVDLFLNEAKIAALLNHPNIVQTFEVGEHGGDLFIAMEYVHGADTRDIIRAVRGRGDQLSLEQVLYLGSQVAAALHHAHTARDISGRPLNIVHRDVSLSNIVVGYDGQVKLVDFGVATASVVTGGPEGLIGKCSYMSPEQIRGQPLDGRSDIFSLGVVLYELITGKPMFRRDTDEKTLLAVLHDSIPTLSESGVPVYVERVLLRAIARQREQRYTDAREFELSIEECLQRLSSTVNAHSLGVFMKELFGERATTPPIDAQVREGTGVPSGASASTKSVSGQAPAPATRPQAPARPLSGSFSVASKSGSRSRTYNVDEMPWESKARPEEATVIDGGGPSMSGQARALRFAGADSAVPSHARPTPPATPAARATTDAPELGSLAAAAGSRAAAEKEKSVSEVVPLGLPPSITSTVTPAQQPSGGSSYLLVISLVVAVLAVLGFFFLR